MSFTPIPGGPPVPNSGDPIANFDADYEAFYGWEKNSLAPGVNAAVAEIEDLAEVVVLAASEVSDNADAVAAALADAQAAAASAMNAPGTQATSSSSLSVSLGAKSLTLDQLGKDFAQGQQLVLARASAPATRQFARLDAFTSSTGAMNVTVQGYEGSGGPYTDWIVSLGTATPAGIPDLTREGRTSNTNITSADKGKWIDITSGTFAQTSDNAATLGANFSCELGNSGSGVATYLGLAIHQGQRYRLHSDGTTIRTTALTNQGAIAVRDEKTSGTAGGTLTATTWNTRALNTVQANTISGASLNAGTGEVTLPAGRYAVSGRTPYGTSAFHKARLYNVTAAAVVIYGSTGSAGTGMNGDSVLAGEFTLTNTSTLRVEHYAATSGGGNDGGRAGSLGVVEVYTEIMFRKVG